MKTKHNEIIIETSDLERIKNLYLAERVLRTWTEDFVDEDSGEIVTITRHEILFEKGTYLDANVMSELSFFIQGGSISSVKASSIQRNSRCSNSPITVYLISATVGTKNKNYLLYAKSVNQAIEIATDFLEQTLLPQFSFNSVKKLNYTNLIPEPETTEHQEESENPGECEYYSITLEITKEDIISDQSFILMAKNADDGKKKAEQFIISKMDDSERKIPIETSILSAKVIKCEDVIDYRFSKVYFDYEDEKEA